MSKGELLPELKEILGAMIFGADRPLSVKEMRKCLAEVAEAEGGVASTFGKVRDDDVAAALGELGVEIAKGRCGFALGEVAGGFRFHSDPSCGRWLKHLLNSGKPNRLSRPALETLAIIAYRQPIARSDIEAIRGVNVDHIMRLLLEMQLIRIAGRSELPGRPFLYGTTQAFLEHFGLKNLNDLNQMEPLMLMRREQAGARAAAGQEERAAPAESKSAPEPAADPPAGSPASAEVAAEP